MYNDPLSPVGTCILLCYQVLRSRVEVVKHILLPFKHASLVPCLSIFAVMATVTSKKHIEGRLTRLPWYWPQHRLHLSAAWRATEKYWTLALWRCWIRHIHTINTDWFHPMISPVRWYTLYPQSSLPYLPMHDEHWNGGTIFGCVEHLLGGVIAANKSFHFNAAEQLHKQDDQKMNTLEPLFL